MSDTRFHPLLRHRQLRRAAVVGLTFLVELAASCWLPMAGADDRNATPQATAELAVRKRILANWQARQDRIRSFYVAWKVGPNDRPPRWTKAEVPGLHQVWVARDGRFREEFPSFAFGRRQTVAHQQRVFDGKYLRTRCDSSSRMRSSRRSLETRFRSPDRDMCCVCVNAGSFTMAFL